MSILTADNKLRMVFMSVELHQDPITNSLVETNVLEGFANMIGYNAKHSETEDEILQGKFKLSYKGKSTVISSFNGDFKVNEDSVGCNQIAIEITSILPGNAVEAYMMIQEMAKDYLNREL